MFYFFFFQAEDGIRDIGVTGVQTCALPIYAVLTDSEHTWVQAFLRYRPLTRFGKYSYGIYVFHVPIFYFARLFGLRLAGRSEERRVGKECRSRWSADHYKNKNKRME